MVLIPCGNVKVVDAKANPIDFLDVSSSQLSIRADSAAPVSRSANRSPTSKRTKIRGQGTYGYPSCPAVNSTAIHTTLHLVGRPLISFGLSNNERKRFGLPEGIVLCLRATVLSGKKSKEALEQEFRDWGDRWNVSGGGAHHGCHKEPQEQWTYARNDNIAVGGQSSKTQDSENTSWCVCVCVCAIPMLF